LGRIRRGFNAVKSEFEREIGMDDVRRQLHNEQIMEEVKKIQQETQEFTNEIAGTGSGLAPGELADHPDLSTDPGPTTTADTAEENIASDLNPTQMEILPSRETQKSEKDRKVGEENESGG
jgi:sec-independent protein translocase protein TatB